MNIEEAILEEQSKTQSEIIASYIGHRSDRFADLMTLVLGNHEVAARRASWTMGHCCERYPELAVPWVPKLIANISEKELHHAIKRNTLKVLQTAKLPTELLGTLFNLCFDFVNNVDQTAAVRIYAVTILGRISLVEPELIEEVTLLIRQHLTDASGGFRVRSKRVLDDFSKLQN